MEFEPYQGPVLKTPPAFEPYEGPVLDKKPSRPTLVERAWKGIQNTAAETAGNIAKLPFVAAPILPESVKSGLSSFVDATDDFTKRNAAPEAKGIAENVVDIGAGLAPFLATGPVGAVGILNNAITGGMSRGMEHGESAPRALAGGIAAGIGNAVMMGLPMGNLSQAAKSAVAMPVIGAADRAIQNQINTAPDLQQEVFNPKSMVTDLAMGLGFSGLAHFQNVRASNKLVDSVASRLERGEPVHPDETARVAEIAKGGIGANAKVRAQGLIDGVVPSANDMPASPFTPEAAAYSVQQPAPAAVPAGPISSAVNKHLGIGYNPVVEQGWDSGNRQQFGGEGRQDGREPFISTVEGEVIPAQKGIGYQEPAPIIDGEFSEVNHPAQLEWKPRYDAYHQNGEYPSDISALYNSISKNLKMPLTEVDSVFQSYTPSQLDMLADEHGFTPADRDALRKEAELRRQEEHQKQYSNNASLGDTIPASEPIVTPSVTGNLAGPRLFPEAKTLPDSPLTPAVIRDGKIYPVESNGDVHDTVIRKNRLGMKNDANERGFLTPDKQFLNREEASAYMKGLGHDNVPDSLHSEDLWKATGKNKVAEKTAETYKPATVDLTAEGDGLTNPEGNGLPTREEIRAALRESGLDDTIPSQVTSSTTPAEWKAIHEAMINPINNVSTTVKGVGGKPATDSAFTKWLATNGFTALVTDGASGSKPNAKFSNKTQIQRVAELLSQGKPVEKMGPDQQVIARHMIEDMNHQHELAKSRTENKTENKTEKIDDSGWQQQVGIEGDIKRPEFGGKPPTGNRVGTSEFMDGFTPDPQMDMFKNKPVSKAVADNDLPFSLGDSAKGKGLSAEEAAKHVSSGKLVSSTDIPAEIVRQAKEKHGQEREDIKGYIDTKSGEYKLVHDNISDVADLRNQAKHEITHSGQTDKLMDSAVTMFKRAKGNAMAEKYINQAAESYKHDLNTEDGYRNAVKEATAKMMEDGLDNGIVRQVIAKVRQYLMDKGWIVKDISDNDLRQVATEMLRKGEKSLSASPEITRGMSAMDKVISEKKNFISAMKNPELGEVSFYWGEPGDPNKGFKGGSGISHIIAQRGENIARKMVEVIANGKVTRRFGPNKGERADVALDGHTAILSLYKMGNKETWLLTGWKDNAPDVPGSDSALSGPTHNGPTLNRTVMGAGASNTNATPTTENVKPDVNFSFRSKVDDMVNKTPAIKESVDWLKSIVNLPSQMAQSSRNSMGKMMGMRNQYSDKLEAMIKEIDKTPGYARFMKGMNSMESFFDKRSKEDNAKFHDKLRAGDIDSMTPEEQKIAAIGKQLDGEFADLVRAVDPTFPLRENHGMMTLKWMFEGADKNDPLAHVSARLMGDTAFTKKYSGKSATEILSSGADAELNPIRVLRKSLSDHIKYVSGSILMKDGMDTGRYIYVPKGGKATEGFAKIPDNIAKVFKRIINPDTIQGSEFVDKAQYEGLMEVVKNIGIDPQRVVNAGRGRLGYFSPLDGVVTQHNTDLSVLAHEVGHAIDIGKGMLGGNGYDLWNRIVTEAKGVGARGTETKAVNQKMRATIKTELRNIADMMGERGGKGYTRKRVEQIAQMVESYIHAPDVMKETAPNVYKAFDEFVKSEPKLAKLAELQPGTKLTELNYEHKVPPPVYAKAFNVMDGEGNILGSFPQKDMAQRNMERLGGERVSIQIGKPTSVHAGDWYMPKPEAEALNRYLEADPLRKNPIVRGALEAKGLFTTAELYGLFHFSNITEEGIRAKTSDIFRSVADGDISGAVKNMKETTSYGMLDIADKMLKDPAGFANNPEVQQKLSRAGITPERFQSSLQALYDGGLKLHRTEHEKSTQAKLLDRASEKYPVLGGVRLAKEAVFSVTDALFKKFVPDLKLSAAINALHTNERLYADRLASGEMTHEQMVRNTVNSIENRFGEINYENLMMPKSFKTSLQLIFRAPGWNIGTWREIPNAVRTQANEIKRAIDKGERPLLTQEFSWLVSTVALHIAEASIIGYTAAAATGDDTLKPKEWNDFFFPKVAAMTRIVPPGYLKDVFGMYHDMQSAPFFLPVNFLQSKLAGQWGRMAEIFRNKDYYGAQVRNAEDNPLVQAKDVVLHMLPTPLFVRSINAEREQAASNPATMIASGLGFNKAPSWIEKSPAQLQLDSYKSKGDQALSKEDSEDRKTKKEVLSYERQGKDIPPELQAKLDKMSPDREKRIMKEGEKTQLETDFGRVSNASQAVSVWNKMSKEEKQATADIMLKKINLDRKKLQNDDERLAKLEKMVAPIETEIDKLDAPAPATESTTQPTDPQPAEDTSINQALAARREKLRLLEEDE